MRRWILALGAFAALTAAADAASAQITVSRSSGIAPELGRTIRGASATTFTVSTTGMVTRTSGDAIRLTTGSVRAPTITFSCGSRPQTDDCRNSNIRITIIPSSTSGAASITRFRVSSLNNATFVSGSPPAEAQWLSFDVRPLGNRTASFDLGMDVRVVAGAASGFDTYDYLVVAQVL
jgi:hypothetical protein